MATKHQHFTETDYAVAPSWSHACGFLRNFLKATLSTPEVAPEVTGQVGRQVAGQVAEQVTDEVGVVPSSATIQVGGRACLPFLSGWRDLFTANPSSLCSTGSILAGLFLPGLDVPKLKGFFAAQSEMAGQVKAFGGEEQE